MQPAARTLVVSVCTVGAAACGQGSVALVTDGGPSPIDARSFVDAPPPQTDGSVSTDAGRDSAASRVDSGIASDAGFDAAPIFIDAGTWVFGDASGFAFGSYQDCFSVIGANHNTFSTLVGRVPGLTLTLAGYDGGVVASFVQGPTIPFDTSVVCGPPETDEATLLPIGASITGLSAICVQGPGETGGGPATLSEQSGALLVQQGVAMLTVAGTETRADSCAQMPDSGPGLFSLVCVNGPIVPDPPAPANPARFPVGSYACSAVVTDPNPNVDGVGGGLGGTLAITQDGGIVTATYEGDSFVTGTLLFVPPNAALDAGTSPPPVVAHASPNQALPFACTLGATPDTLLQITAASLMGNLESGSGISEITLAFSGTFTNDASCAGQRISGLIYCGLGP